MTGAFAVQALAWGFGAAAGLLAWPWLLGWLTRRRPAWLEPALAPAPADLRGAAASRGPLGGATLAAWLSLVLAASVLPLGRDRMAADLDAGGLWLLALATAALPWQRRLPAGVVAGAVVAVASGLLGPVLRVASLNLSDLVIAQQGGAGNWFLLRDPFLLLGAGIQVLLIALLWAPAPAAAGRGLDGWFAVAVHAGVPLVLAHLLVVVHLGGWWAPVPALDGLEPLQTLLKVAGVLALVIWLRRRVLWLAPRALQWLLPLAALACATGSAVWMLASGAAP